MHKANLITGILWICHLIRAQSKSYMVFKHSKLLACVVVYNSLRTTWFWLQVLYIIVWSISHHNLDFQHNKNLQLQKTGPFYYDKSCLLYLLNFLPSHTCFFIEQQRSEELCCGLKHSKVFLFSISHHYFWERNDVKEYYKKNKKSYLLLVAIKQK